MTSPAQVAANRDNAKQSTGPRTARGRRRVSRNALRHNLSVPIVSLPEYDAMVTRLTLALLGSNTSPKIGELARRVAEAEVDLRRVRILRRNLFVKPLLRHWSIPELHRLIMAGNAPVRVAFDGLVYVMPESEVEIERITARIRGRSREFARLDRYERRALSRRKFAIRALYGLVESGGARCTTGRE